MWWMAIFVRLSESLRNIGFWYGVISLVIQMLISVEDGTEEGKLKRKKQWIIRDVEPQPLRCPYTGIKSGRENWWDVKIPIKKFYLLILLIVSSSNTGVTFLSGKKIDA